MPLSDYAHWNEDAEYMWWHEEGKHVEDPRDFEDEQSLMDQDRADNQAELEAEREEEAAWQAQHPD